MRGVIWVGGGVGGQPPFISLCVNERTGTMCPILTLSDDGDPSKSWPYTSITPPTHTHKRTHTNTRAAGAHTHFFFFSTIVPCGIFKKMF